MTAFLSSTKATYGGNPVLKAFCQRLYLRTHDEL
jgi:hypothetical protein